MYQKTNPEIEKKIQNILEGDYEISVLGTNGKDNFPFLSKIIPMYKNNKLYLLISDISEHTQNINNLFDKLSQNLQYKELFSALNYRN